MIAARRRFLGASLGAGMALLAGRSLSAADEPPISAGPLGYRLTRDVPAKLFHGGRCWCHPRAGMVPGAGRGGQPRVVMTMNLLDLAGSDVFRAMFDLRTDDETRSYPRPTERMPHAAPATGTIASLCSILPNRPGQHHGSRPPHGCGGSAGVACER